jgi:hypothetical protein
MYGHAALDAQPHEAPQIKNPKSSIDILKSLSLGQQKS